MQAIDDGAPWPRAPARLDPVRALQRFPLAPHGLSDRVTRSEDAFVLCHLGVPRLDPGAWSLLVDGLCAREVRLGLKDLLAQPKLELTSVHQCCGSPFAPFEPTRRVCNVRWGGARLVDVLRHCQPLAEARFAWCFGADHGEFAGDPIDAYCKDLPLARAAADVLLAYEMNGVPLTPEHGAPARLVVPGFYGTNSVKWLIRVSLARERAPGPFTTRHYSDPVLDASGEETGEHRPVWAIAPESVIVAPAPGATASVLGEREVWGWAWADGGVKSVVVRSSDDGEWSEATLERAEGRAWQRFTFSWKPQHRGPVLLSSRATSNAGQRQPLAGRRNSVFGVQVMVV